MKNNNKPADGVKVEDAELMEKTQDGKKDPKDSFNEFNKAIVLSELESMINDIKKGPNTLLNDFNIIRTADHVSVNINLSLNNKIPGE